MATKDQLLLVVMGIGFVIFIYSSVRAGIHRAKMKELEERRVSNLKVRFEQLQKENELFIELLEQCEAFIKTGNHKCVDSLWLFEVLNNKRG